MDKDRKNKSTQKDGGLHLKLNDLVSAYGLPWWLRLETELPYDPAIPVLGTCPETIIIQKDTWTLMFTEALFATASAL